MNQVNLIGNVTRDPELKFLANGNAVCNFGLAVQDGYMKDGQWQEGKTIFIDVTQFGRQAERTNGTVTKGCKVFVGGKLKYDSWDDKNTGQKRSKHSVSANEVHVLSAAKPQQSQQDDREDAPW